MRRATRVCALRRRRACGVRRPPGASEGRFGRAFRKPHQERAVAHARSRRRVECASYGRLDPEHGPVIPSGFERNRSGGPGTRRPCPVPRRAQPGDRRRNVDADAYMHDGQAYRLGEPRGSGAGSDEHRDRSLFSQRVILVCRHSRPPFGCIQFASGIALPPSPLRM